ncbi:MAG: hypothetical protein SVU32_08030, partial [Candidatus Nanohaloarchaea archaeon]|nr:hypothetical protein [Candidatus Nanohaloarchaea archaeon]
MLAIALAGTNFFAGASVLPQLATDTPTGFAARTQSPDIRNSSQHPTELVLTNNDSCLVRGETFDATATLTSNGSALPGRDVSFFVNSEWRRSLQTDSRGRATAKLQAGSNRSSITIEAAYSGSNAYASANDTAIQTVHTLPDYTIDTRSSVAGTDTRLRVDLRADTASVSGKNVTITAAGSKRQVVTGSNGTASITLQDLPEGTYNYSAVFTSRASCNETVQAQGSGSFTVDPAVVTSLAVGENHIYANQSVTVTARMTDTFRNATAYLYIGDRRFRFHGNGTNRSLRISELVRGTHTIRNVTVWSGSRVYGERVNQQLRVTGLPTTLDLELPRESVYTGTRFNFSGRLTYNGTGISDRQIMLRSSLFSQNVTTDRKGRFTATVSVREGQDGTYDIRTVFDGTRTYAPVSVQHQLRVEPWYSLERRQKPARIGEPVRWTVDVTCHGPGARNISLPDSASIVQSGEHISVSGGRQGKIAAIRCRSQSRASQNRALSTASFNTANQPERLVYTTPAPEKTVERVHHAQKAGGKVVTHVTVSSKVSGQQAQHYRNVKTCQQVPEGPDSYDLLWKNPAGNWVEVTANTSFSFSVSDGKACWTVPHLSSQSFQIVGDFHSLRVSDTTTGDNWTVYFNASGTGTLSIDVIQGSGKIDFTSLQQYQSSWVTLTDSGTEPVSVSWDGEQHSLGRVVFDIQELGVYRVNISLGNDWITAQNFARFQQDSLLLNLTSQTVPYTQCSYESVFWICDPHDFGDTHEPGYRGETYNFSGGAVTRRFSIPTDATVTNFSIRLEDRTNESLQQFPLDQFVEIAQVREGGRDEIVVASQSRIEAWNSSNTLLWTYTPEYTINSLTTGNVNVSSAGHETVYASESSMIVLDANGSRDENISMGTEFIQVAAGDIASEYTLKRIDDRDAEGYRCIGCNSGSNRFRYRLPYNVSNISDNTVYVTAGLNRRGDGGNLTLILNGTMYDVPEQKVSRSTIFSIGAGDSSPESLAEVTDRKRQNLTLHFDNTDEVEDMRQIYIRSALSYTGGKTGNLLLRVGNRSYDVADSQVTENAGETLHSQDDAHPEALSCVGCNSGANATRFDVPYSLDTSGRATFVRAAFNRRGSGGNLRLLVDGTSYDVDEDAINISATLNYSADDGEPDDFATLDGIGRHNVSLWYDVPQRINASTVWLKTAFNYRGSRDGELQLTVNGATYGVNERQIIEDNRLNYSIHDNETDNASCVGCMAGGSESKKAIFDTSAFDIPSRVPARSITLRSGFCYVGQRVDDLTVYGPALNDTSYSINPAAIPACSGDRSTWTWVETQIKVKDLEEGKIYFKCDLCNTSSYYRMMADNSTSGHSTYWDGTSESSVPYDWMIEFRTNESLQFDWVYTQVQREDVQEGVNVTYSCQGCNTSHGYNLMADASVSGHSYDYNGSWFKRDDDFMTRVWSNQSLNYDTVSTQVKASDINATGNLTYVCTDCNDSSSFNLLRDTSTSGNSYVNTSNGFEQVSGSDFIVRVRTVSLNHSWVTTPIDRIVANEGTNISYSCQGCNATHHFNVLTDDAVSGHSYTYNGTGWLERPRDLMAQLWTNQSLRYSLVRTEVDPADVNTSVNATYVCTGCNNTNAFHILTDTSVGGHSFLSTDGGTSYTRINGEDGIIRLELFGSNRGDEIIASRWDAVLFAFNSTGADIWNHTLPNRPAEIAVGDITSQTGNEIAVATRDRAEVIGSDGNVLWQYPSSGTRWIRGLALADINASNRGDEVVIGSDGGILSAHGSNGTQLWNVSVSASIRTVLAGDILRESGKEVLAGLGTGDIVLYNATGTRVTSYQRSQRIRDGAIGDTHEVTGNETALSVDSGGSEVLNLFSVPYNLSIDVGGDGTDDYFHRGLFRGQERVFSSSLTDAFQQYLNTCSGDTCSIPVVFDSAKPGRLRVRLPELAFSYNISSIIQVQNHVTKWARTTNIHVREQVRYDALKLSYPNIPAFPVNVRRITSPTISSVLQGQANPDTIRFNNASFQQSRDDIYLGYVKQNGTVVEPGLAYWLSTFQPLRSPDYLWYDASKTDTPVRKYRTSATTTFGDRTFYNISIWRATTRTSTTFRNITFNATHDEIQIQEDIFLSVDWNNDTNFVDITPPTSTGTCDSNSPDYTRINANGTVFFVCKEDTDGDSKIGFFRVKQPIMKPRGNPSANVSYRLGGITNSPPEAGNGSVSPQQAIWGTTFNFSVQIDEPDTGDEVNVSLWVYQRVRDSWNRMGWTERSGTASWANFTVNSSRYWTGSNRFRFSYYDMDDSNNQLHPAENTSILTGPRGLKHRVRVRNMTGESITMQRVGEVRETSIRLEDLDAATNVSGGVTCEYRIRSSGSFTTYDTVVPSEQGFCNVTLRTLDFPVGTHVARFRAVEGSFYRGNTSQNFSLTLQGGIRADTDIDPERVVYRNDSEPNHTIIYNLTAIRNLFNRSIDVKYAVEWLPERGLVDGGGGATTRNSSLNNTNSPLNVRESSSLGLHWLTITLNKNDYRKTIINRTLQVYGSFATERLNPPDGSTVAASDDTIDLEINVTNDRGDPVTDATLFYNIPPGSCVNGIEHLGSGRYRCRYDPANSITGGSHNWSVTVSRALYDNVTTSNFSIDVRATIDANVTLSPATGSLHRYNGTSRSDVNWTVSDIEAGGDPINNVDYWIFFDDTLIEHGQTDSSGTNGSYNVPDTAPVGPHSFTLKLNKSGYRRFNTSQQFEVEGYLNTTVEQNTQTVFKNNSATFGTYRTAGFFAVRVLNDLGQPVDNADISWTTADGSCASTRYEGNGIYNCTYVAADTGSAGEKTWTATATKQYFEDTDDESEQVELLNELREKLHDCSPFEEP